MRIAIISFFAMAAISCGSIPKRDDLDKIKAEAKNQDGGEIVWQKDAESAAAVEKEIDALIKKPLTKEGAIQLALYSNRELQAQFDRIGVAHANIWQATLFKNPTIDFASKFPLSGGEPKIEAGLEWSIADLFARSARIRMAEAEANETAQNVAQAVRDLIQQTKSAYFDYQFSLHMYKIEQTTLETAEMNLNLQRRLFAAGNISDLDLATEEAHVAALRLELQSQNLEVAQKKETLQKLFGLWGKKTEWNIIDTLPKLPAKDLPIDALEFTAVKNRGDLQGMMAGLETIKAELDQVKTVRWIPALDLGVGVISDFGEKFGVGPQVRWEIPIFDQGSARIERLVNLYRMKLRAAENLAVQIRSEARQSRNKMVTERERIRYFSQTLLPLRAKVTDETQLFYNGMLMGLPQLLNAKQEELKTQKEYLLAHKQYWIAYSELERATGSRMSAEKEGKNDTK